MLTITPRIYQKSVVRKIIDSYKRGINRQLFVSATGTGKTYTATFLRDQFRPHLQTIFLVDEIQLAYQARESFLKADPSLQVGLEMSKQTHNPDDDVIITSVPTISRSGSSRIEKFNPEKIGLVVVDEAHKSVSESWIKVLNYFQVGPENSASNKMLLGMTATPNRPDGKSLGTLYDDITENYDIRWALENGWLTDFEFLRVNTNTDISKVRIREGEFNQIELADAVNNKERNLQIYKTYRKYCDGEPAICFSASVDHAIHLTRLFNYNDIPSAVIHAKTNKEKRAEYISKFKSGDIWVLFNYGTLTTGFDAPDTSTIILGRPIGSDLLYQQIIGRGLRPSTDSYVNKMDTPYERKIAMKFSTKPNCKIIDFHDVTTNRNACTPAHLFGLHRDLTPEKGQGFFKNIVKRLDEIKRKECIDVSKISDLENIQLQIQKAKLNQNKSLNNDGKIKLHSYKSWLEITSDHYEIAYSDNKKVLIVKSNKLDQFELKEYDFENNETKKLKSFESLSGAIAAGDDHADKNYNNYVNVEFDCINDGVTQRQARHLRHFLKGKGLFIDSSDRYEDTGQLVMYLNGELLTKKKATLVLQELFR